MSARVEILADGVEKRIKPCMAAQDHVTIYALLDPDSLAVRYVGKTIYTVQRRLTYHITAAKSAKYPSSNWLRSLSLRGLRPQISILEKVPINSDWAERERFWIAKQRANGARLLNLTEGGEGVHEKKISGTRHAERISERLRRGAFFACKVCSKEFWRKPFDIERGNNKFCSRECYQSSLRGVSRAVPIECMVAGVSAAAAKKRAMENCKRGHPLSGDNLFRTSSGGRGCKECRKIRKLKYLEKINARAS